MDFARAIRAITSLVRTSTDGAMGRMAQTVQAKFSTLERKDAVPVMQHFGFASVVPEGADGLAASTAGDRAGAVIIATNHQDYRPPVDLAVGDTCIFDKAGNYVVIRASGDMEAVSHGSITARAPIVNIEASEEANITTPVLNIRASEAVNIITPLITTTAAITSSADGETLIMHGNLETRGTIKATGEITAASGGAGVRLTHHTHSGIQPGSSNTNAPNAGT